MNSKQQERKWTLFFGRPIFLGPLIAVSLFLIYNLNPSFLQGYDSRPSVLASISLAKRGDLNINEFDSLIRQPNGDLPYYAIGANNGAIVSRFNLGIPLVSAPVFWVVLTSGDGKIVEDDANFVGKWVSSGAVALSAWLIFLTALRLSRSRRQAAVCALLYGLGTCAFSTVSQALWQHGPAELFLSLGTYLLVRNGKWSVPCSGAAFGMMVLARPVTVVFALAALAYVLVKDRRVAVFFVLAALPFAVVQGWYNTHYFGAPWVFGQMLEVTGGDSLKRDYWNNPMWSGMAGLLVSPSRGLFVYSPFFLFLLWRPVQNWRETHVLLRYHLVACLVMMLILSRYYGWYGGWAFGYRMIVDAAPILCLAMLPVLARLPQHKPLLAGFVGSCLVAASIHFVGAYCYDVVHWDGMPNIDFHPDRLWTIRDSQLVYWFSHLEFRPILLR